MRTIDRRTRAAAGELLFPHVYPSSLIDGKGPYTAQVANVATSEAEAIALVDKAKANGFIGVKFYGTFNPAWLPASIAEAHKLGLHVHGHIPAGIRPIDAINDGYDEITHINWVMMQAMPDSVIPVSNGIMRFEGPGRYAKDVDLEGPAIKTIVATMASKHIYSDPTMVAFESLYVPENGDLSPSYAPFVGTLPPTTERGFRSGGFAVPKDLTRADYRASWAKMVELLGRMHKAGVPIVAGTDGAGIEIVHELEIYVQAGFTPAEALAAATIVPARLVGQDAKTGSIKVGQGRRPGARRGRSVDADRRPAPDARRHARRQAARRRRAADGGRLLRTAEIADRSLMYPSRAFHGLAIALATTLSGATSAGQERAVATDATSETVVGLLDIPDLVGEGCGLATPSSRDVFDEPTDPAPRGALTFIVHGRSKDGGTCDEGRLVLRARHTPQDLGVPTEESDYEVQALVVYERSGEWFRVSLPRGSGWVRGTAQDFLPYPDLLVRRLAYIRKHWDGQLWSEPGGVARGRASRVARAPR